MQITSALFFGALALAAGYAIMIYNGLVRLRHGVSRAWANIDVLLKQRHDELPKLVETCRQYAQFEGGTLARVVDARARVSDALSRHDVAALGSAEGALRSGLGQIFATVEAYPELRANEQFMQLHSRISALENAIADRREGYNDAVNLLNVRVEEFPDLIVARMFGFDTQALLRFSSTEKSDPDLKTLFGS